MIRPDDDATELDRYIMAVANTIEETQPDSAEELRTAAAYLRETWEGRLNPEDPRNDVLDALSCISDSASRVVVVLRELYVSGMSNADLGEK